MAKIQDNNRFYDALRSYVDFTFKMAYHRVEYVGKENIPKDGAIIYAPNHTNTLMDALAVLAIDRNPKIFVARADVFKNPTAHKILTFLKMLPINRKRDGNENLAKNEEINDIVVDVLHDKIPFCILPEGTHRAKHSLMALQKGIFRIALQANTNFGDNFPIYIVPVGLEFGHFFRYRSSLLVQIGKPINVTEVIKNNGNLTEPEQINVLRDLLSSKIKDLIIHIQDDENYDATLELCHVCNNEAQKELGVKNNKLINRFLASKNIVQKLESSLKINSLETTKLLQETIKFSKQRHEAKIGAESVVNKHLMLSIIAYFLFLLLTFPYFVFSLLVTFPITLTSFFLCKLFKDKAFHNTVKYLISLVLLPILLIIIGLAVGLGVGYLYGFIAVILSLPAFFFFYDYLRFFRLIISGIKWKFSKKWHAQCSKIAQDFWDLNKEK